MASPRYHEPRMAERPILVIVGRPNVGKSALFNRITGSRRSIVGDQPGITRDRILLDAEWHGKKFRVTDTGGMTFGDTAEFPVLINEQVRAAVEQASRVVFVVDGRGEATATDQELADFLRRTGRAVTVAVNKCDTDRLNSQADAFFELGFGEPIPVSAEHNRGMTDLLAQATADFPESDEADHEPDRFIRIAIIGRPNTGKSTLLNRLTGQGHSIVSPTAGTTRDAVDAQVTRDGVTFEFVDTAGIRRKGKTTELTEKLSVVMARRHLRMADVALLMMDAEEGVAGLDATIAGYAQEEGRGLILVVNKWDLVTEQKQADFRQDVRDRLRYLEYAPLVLISALRGERTDSIFPLVRKTYREWRKRIPTAELNRFLERVDFDRVTVPGFKKPRISYVTQPRTGPPTFVFFNNRNDDFHFGFERFLINQLRREYGFEGSPIVIKSKRKRRSSS